MDNNKIALIRDGMVANIILSDLDFAQKLGYDEVVPLSGKMTCSIGDLWNGAKFTSGPVDTTTENQRTIEEQAAQALTQLRAYLALSSPTAAQRLAFEKLMARVVIGLVRLQLKQLDGTA